DRSPAHVRHRSPAMTIRKLETGRPGMKHVTWGSAGRILVAEEDESYASTVAAVLQGQGYRVDVAPSAAAALERLRQDRYGLVLVHYGLPDRTGVALLEQARGEGLLEGVAEMLFTGKHYGEATAEDPAHKKLNQMQPLYP